MRKYWFKVFNKLTYLGSLFLLSGALLFSCHTPPYEPALLLVPEKDPGNALRACIPSLHAIFPRIKRIENDYLVSDWIPGIRGGIPVKFRAEIVAEKTLKGTLLKIAVHRLRLWSSPFSNPKWVNDDGDAALEKKILRALKVELRGEEIKPHELARIRPGSRENG